MNPTSTTTRRVVKVTRIGPCDICGKNPWVFVKYFSTRVEFPRYKVCATCRPRAHVQLVRPLNQLRPVIC